MYLSRLELNPRSREARRDVASAYELHRTLISRAFPEGLDGERRLLFRLDEVQQNGRLSMVVLVQTCDAQPDWTHLPEDYSLHVAGPKLFTPRFVRDQQFSFRLLANPIARSRTDERSESGHARYHRRGLLAHEEQQAWLDRKGEGGGFRPLFSVITPSLGPRRPPSGVTHEHKVSIPHAGVRYDGVLQITDPDLFVETLQSGIGPAKAFGFGLLSIAPLRA